MSSDARHRILILSDSGANPRSFPPSMAVRLEETYPYLLRARFPRATFYQLSFGNITTEDLVSQATAYLTHWSPHFIVVQSGLVDCRPEAFTHLEKAIIERLPGRMFGPLRKNLARPSLVARRQIFRVPKQSFRKTVTKFKMIFSRSKIFWLEICTAPDYEQERPGIGARMAEYNAVLKETYAEAFVGLQGAVDADGFNRDHTHFTSRGHRAIAQLIIDRIEAVAGPAAEPAPRAGVA